MGRDVAGAGREEQGGDFAVAGSCCSKAEVLARKLRVNGRRCDSLRRSCDHCDDFMRESSNAPDKKWKWKMKWR